VRFWCLVFWLFLGVFCLEVFVLRLLGLYVGFVIWAGWVGLVIVFGWGLLVGVFVGGRFVCGGDVVVGWAGGGVGWSGSGVEWLLGVCGGEMVFWSVLGVVYGVGVLVRCWVGMGGFGEFFGGVGGWGWWVE